MVIAVLAFDALVTWYLLFRVAVFDQVGMEVRVVYIAL